VSGRLETDRLVIRPTALPASVPHMEPDPTIVIVGAPEPASPAVPAPPPRIADALGLVLDARLAHEAWIRRADAEIELGGAVRLEKPPGGALRLLGHIQLLRGWYAFEGRRFTIQEGTITWTGTPPEPILDVTAVYRTQLYRIVVRVEGAGEKPRLTLSSDPPLEQADILAVLLFGKPIQSLGREQSLGLQQQALQLASAYVVPELRTSVVSALGLDTLEVKLPQGAEQPGRVAVGRYFAPDIFVALAQEFGSRAAEVVSVEYALTPSFSVRGSASSRGDTAVDAFWHRRY
jgi:translocation and assembly module TamB